MDRKKLESVQATGQEDAKFSLASAFMLVLVVKDVVFCQRIFKKTTSWFCHSRQPSVEDHHRRSVHLSKSDWYVFLSICFALCPRVQTKSRFGPYIGLALSRPS